MAQWIENWPANQRVASLIPSQDTCLGCGPCPWLGEYEGQPTDILKIIIIVMADVAQWIEHQPANQRVASLIPSQGTFLGYGPGLQQGAHERQPHTDWC